MDFILSFNRANRLFPSFPLLPSTHHSSSMNIYRKNSHLRFPYSRVLEERKDSLIYRDPFLNKDTGFTVKERGALKINGLLPFKVEKIEEQRERLMKHLRSLSTPFEKFLYLQSIKHSNLTVFYNMVINHIEELLPIIYIGTVCKHFGAVAQISEGLYFSKKDMGKISTLLDNLPNEDIEVIVISDGSRILGLGDLGVNGMGIPLGKIHRYVAAGGFHGEKALPVLFDAGTNNEELLNDPHYLGEKHTRIPDEEYYFLMDEFIDAVKKKWSRVIVQFEDFSHDHAFDLFQRYNHKIPCFNDDIQGTGAVVGAGILNACRLDNKKLGDHRFLIVGAGSAGIGVADQLVELLAEEEIYVDDAKKLIYLVDSSGLITERPNLPPWKRKYARKDMKPTPNLIEIAKQVKPTALIGLSSIPNIFNEDIVREVAKNTERPIIFPLSNPSEMTEVNPGQAFRWTNGKCIIATGSPFPNVVYNGRLMHTSEANNMYIYPGLGFGAYLCGAKRITSKMFTVAAKTLSEQVSKRDLEDGKLYPPIALMRNVSAEISTAVIAQCIIEQNAIDTDFLTPLQVKSRMYKAMMNESYVHETYNLES